MEDMMSKIDQFESLFRSAVQTQYTPRSYPIRDVLVLTDLPEGEDTTYLSQLEPFFDGLSAKPKLTLIPREQSEALEQLIELIQGHQVDLICTYRNLHTSYGAFPYTLGGHVEVLTQVCEAPILLTARPEQLGGARMESPHRVMALTDQFEEHPHLIDAATAFVKEPGALILSHVEDSATFERYMSAISKIPSIDTDDARVALTQQLISSAESYISRTREAINSVHPTISVLSEVKMGHLISEHTALVAEHRVDLLVMDTKDEDQLAMHGLSHPLAIELSNLPLLML